MVKHKKAVKSPFRVYRILQGKEFYETDGLNNVEYEVLEVSKNLLYTNVTISPKKLIPINAPADDKKFNMLNKIES